jgi:phosphoribosylglycinamide formyltransferase-1
MGKKKRIVLFASGSGSNGENIAHYFADNESIEIVGVFGNNRTAFVFERCAKLGLPAYSFNRKAFADTSGVLKFLQTLDPDLIVLAGFLWKIPESFVQAFPNRIINVHPALLPKYGGKGMYGMHVHEAVKAAGETETGITIHYVNEQYDEGAIIFQAKVAVEPQDTAESIAQKIHELEYAHFPEVVEKVLADG